MAFHGGLIGAAVGIALFARRYKTPAAHRIRSRLARRADRHLPRPDRQFHQAGAVGPADRRALGDDLSRLRRPAAPSQPDLRSAARRAGGLRRPVARGARGRAAAAGPDRRRLRRRSTARRASSANSSATPIRVSRTSAAGLTMGMVLSAPLIVIGLGLIAWSVRAAAGGPSMSALGDEIKAMIASDGPITVERYMELALAHPEHGYYMNRDPFGAEGDFTTAPEISQMFGELIGLWAAEVWTSMGRPNPVRLIELGPGRGTLMSDALRAARIVPEFRAALDVTLIETSPSLANIQYEALLTSGAPIAWRATLSEAPEGPAIILANEFLDALPVRQFVRRGGRWRERMVRLDDSGRTGVRPRQRSRALYQSRGGRRRGARGQRRRPSLHVRARRAAGQTGRRGAVRRLRPWRDRLRRHAAGFARASHGRSAGRSRRSGHHRPCRFRRDGAQRARDRRRRLRPDRPGRLPARARHRRAHARAGRRAPPERADEFEEARRRLVGKDDGEMGALFKAMVVANRSVPPPPGFQPYSTKPA